MWKGWDSNPGASMIRLEFVLVLVGTILAQEVLQKRKP